MTQAGRDLCVILHGTWGVLIAADNSVTAATPDIQAGPLAHAYEWCIDSGPRGALPPGPYSLTVPNPSGNVTLLDSQQVVVNKKGAAIAGKPYLTLSLPSSGICYPARFLPNDGKTVVFSGQDAGGVTGRDFPHTLLFYYANALPRASLRLPSGAGWSGQALSGSAKLHLFAQVPAVPQPMPPGMPSHFQLMARDFGLDLDVSGQDIGVMSSSMMPWCIDRGDLLDLDEMATSRVYPNLLTCGGGAVIYS